MKKFQSFYPSKQGILISAGVGIATKSIAIGIAILVLYIIVAKLKFSRR
jgi:hypothetical protein